MELAKLTEELDAATHPIRDLLDAEQGEAKRRQEVLDQTISEANSQMATLEEDVSGKDHPSPLGSIWLPRQAGVGSRVASAA